MPDFVIFALCITFFCLYSSQTDPIPGWSLYFPGEDYATFSYTDFLEQCKCFFEIPATLLAKKDQRHTMTVTVDYTKLYDAPEFAVDNGGMTVVQELREAPGRVLRCMALAVHQIMFDVVTTELSQSGMTLTPQIGVSNERIPFITVRLQNYDPVTPLKHLKANYIGKYISVKGTVVRVSNVKPLVKNMAFTCTKCNTLIVIPLPDGKFTAPTQCTSKGCRCKLFLPERYSAQTETVDFQKIRIQEIMEDESLESGRIPRTLECELMTDLVDTCVPGDIVVANGEVRVISTQDGPGKGKRNEQAMFLLYMYVNSITGPRTKVVEDAQDDNDNSADKNDMIDFSMKDLFLIQKIQEEQDLFKALVNSLCPAIYGHELVKAGLLLGLFGGRQKHIGDMNKIPVRGDPHILVVGDPGLGKSQMLHAVSMIAPRGVYVCGNTSSVAGLTVTLHKDGSSGDYALEAGALVLGDQGCCCIDEFDKMGSQHTALLEVTLIVCV